MSPDPILEKYLPFPPINDEAKSHNKKLPNGGVFNPINLNLYHYTNNNPIKYVDPNGLAPRNSISYWFLRIFFSDEEIQDVYDSDIYDGFFYFGNEIVFSAIEMPTELISEVADYAAIGLLLTGNVPGAAAAEGISKTADGINLTSKFVRALMSGKESDWMEFGKKSAEIGAEFVIAFSIKKGIAKVKVIRNKGGRYYQLGRRGRLSNKKGFLKKLFQDLSPNVGGKAAEEITKFVGDKIDESEKQKKKK